MLTPAVRFPLEKQQIPQVSHTKELHNWLLEKHGSSSLGLNYLPSESFDPEATLTVSGRWRNECTGASLSCHSKSRQDGKVCFVSPSRSLLSWEPLFPDRTPLTCKVFLRCGSPFSSRISFVPLYAGTNAALCISNGRASTILTLNCGWIYKVFIWRTLRRFFELQDWDIIPYFVIYVIV